jgi:preprotein translocase subunit SecD
MSFHFFICLSLALLIVSAGLAPPAMASGDASPDTEKDSASAADRRETLADGLYLVLRQADDQTKLEPQNKNERILIYDYHFLEPQAHENPIYVVLSQAAFVPVTLSAEPKKEKDERGRPALLMQLEKKQAAFLQELTGKNIGQTMAIVIGNEIVSIHKIKTEIKGGLLQITRCSDNGCEVLYTRLKSTHH